MGVLWVGLGVSRVGLEGGFSSISSVMIAIDVGSELCGGNNRGLRSRSKISGESGDHHDTLLKWDCGYEPSRNAAFQRAYLYKSKVNVILSITTFMPMYKRYISFGIF